MDRLSIRFLTNLVALHVMRIVESIFEIEIWCKVEEDD